MEGWQCSFRNRKVTGDPNPLMLDHTGRANAKKNPNKTTPHIGKLLQRHILGGSGKITLLLQTGLPIVGNKTRWNILRNRENDGTYVNMVEVYLPLLTP